MTTEQFEQIVDAILAGKYSWACVLILKFAGYNPLHYIPYRTYNRLIKDNSTCSRSSHSSSLKSSPSSIKTSAQIKDLSYQEIINSNQELNLGGGFGLKWFDFYSHSSLD
jgi:hypothetical protein